MCPASGEAGGAPDEKAPPQPPVEDGEADGKVERVFRVTGNGPLRGAVCVHGAKNAALPLLAATLLTDDECVLENVPDISDIRVMVDVLRHHGARVSWEEPGRIVVQTAKVCSRTTPDELANQLRGSFLVMGPLLAREGEASAPPPGGCQIGLRPVDVPVKGFRDLGAAVATVDARFSASGKLTGANLVLDYPSVTGTENLIMAAALADGVTVMENASSEPEVTELVTMLQSMGARIRWIGPGTVAVQGVRRLHGAIYRILPDRVEAGTYLCAGAISGGDLTVERVVPRHLHAVSVKLTEAGVRIDQTGSSLRVRIERPLSAVDIRTYPYPGFPTDLQQPFGALLTQADGESMIQETLYSDRLKYVDELAKMGAQVVKLDGQTARFLGPSRLHGAHVCASDLRAGAALVLAGLAADGETVVHRAGLIDRGYAGFAEALRSVGADCREETVEVVAASAVR